MYPWKLGSQCMKYKLKPLRAGKFWAHRTVCSVITQLVCFRDSVTAWFTFAFLYMFKAQ
jgi:hypothetical protein